MAMRARVPAYKVYAPFITFGAIVSHTNSLLEHTSLPRKQPWTGILSLPFSRALLYSCSAEVRSSSRKYTVITVTLEYFDGIGFSSSELTGSGDRLNGEHKNWEGLTRGM